MSTIRHSSAWLRSAWAQQLQVALITMFGVAACDDAGEIVPAPSGETSQSHSAGASGASGASSSPRAELAAVVGDRRVPFAPPNDRAFVDFFVDHHRMAVMMAELEVMHGDRADAKAMAQRMIDMQSGEIDAMKRIASRLADPATAPVPADPHAEADMDHMSMIEGSDMDEMFLTEMIVHHAAGLPVAHRALTTLRDVELRALAQTMMTAQATEIGDMEQMRKQLGIEGAGEDLARESKDRADMGLLGDMRIAFTPSNDVEFIDFFVPHHSMVLEMADVVIQGGQSADVRAMAQKMRDSQTSELSRMTAVRQLLTGDSESARAPVDPHMPPEMERMKSISGTELDEMFLREMIPHHAAGIPTAHRAKPHVQNAELRAMADDIFEAQSTEIGDMQHMLGKNL